MIDAQLASIGARRQERMERFRGACHRIWTELKTSDDDRAKKEADWVVEDQTELPSVIQNIHTEVRIRTTYTPACARCSPSLPGDEHV